MAEYIGSDGTEYFNKPTGGSVQKIGKSSKTEAWIEGEGDAARVWEPVRIGKRIMWRVKAGK